MKSTASLSLESLLSKIHPPLPMSPRESARLLGLLNSSFKHQLDRPPSAGLPDTEHHTDSHLRSILTSPLFDTRINPRGMKSKDEPFGRIQDLVKRPMDIFRKQVSAGTATLQTACLCLKAQYNSCLASPSTTPTDAMKASRAGTTVLQWLWSSGMEESPRFFDSREHLKLLVPFLVAEREHDRILQWLQRLYAETSKYTSPEHCRRYRNLLLDFIKAEVSLGQGLESATTLFIQVAHNPQESGIRFNNLNGAFNYVAYHLTVKLMAIPRSAELQTSTIEPFMNVSKTFTTAKCGTVLGALHGAYLAKSPTPEAALRYLQGLSQRQIAKLTPSKLSRIIPMGLRAAELCLDSNRQAEAVQLMDFLQSNFKSEVVSPVMSDHHDMRKGSSDKAEAQSLHLLDSLAIA